MKYFIIEGSAYYVPAWPDWFFAEIRTVALHSNPIHTTFHFSTCLLTMAPLQKKIWGATTGQPQLVTFGEQSVPFQSKNDFVSKEEHAIGFLIFFRNGPMNFLNSPWTEESLSSLNIW